MVADSHANEETERGFGDNGPVTHGHHVAANSEQQDGLREKAGIKGLAQANCSLSSLASIFLGWQNKPKPAACARLTFDEDTAV